MAGKVFVPPVAPAGWTAQADNHVLDVPHALLSAGLAALDFMLIFAVFVASDALYHHFVLNTAISEFNAAGIGATTGIVVVAFLAFRGAYTVRGILISRGRVSAFLQAWLVAFFIVGWIAFLSKTTSEFSRGAVTISFVAGLLVVLGSRAMVQRALRGYIADARMALRKAFVVHAGDERERGELLRDLASQGVKVMGLATLDPGSEHEAAQWKASLEACRAELAQRHFESVYLFVPWSHVGALEQVKATMLRLPVPVFLFVDSTVSTIMSGAVLDTGVMRAFEIQRAPLSPIERAQKRILDILAASALLLVLAPLFILVSLAILVESGRPVFFRQGRKGFGARPFRIFKFRTMTVCENGDQIRQAERGDSRITPLGRILRRTSVDELPQLFNVLLGQMSMVGPRPHAVAHDNYYDGIIAAYASRHHVKPGLTGWAQISGYRGETREIHQMEGRVELDVWYISHWSIWLDLKILARTAFVILSDKQAY